MTGQTQVLSTVGDLLAVGARRGAGLVLFNAALIAQREVADGAAGMRWTPWGWLPCDHRVNPEHPARAGLAR